MNRSMIPGMQLMSMDGVGQLIIIQVADLDARFRRFFRLKCDEMKNKINLQTSAKIVEWMAESFF